MLYVAWYETQSYKLIIDIAAFQLDKEDISGEGRVWREMNTSGVLGLMAGVWLGSQLSYILISKFQ